MEGRDKCIPRLNKLISPPVSSALRPARSRSPAAICHRSVRWNSRYGLILNQLGTLSLPLLHTVLLSVNEIADVRISDYGDTKRKAELTKHPRPPGYSLGSLAT